MKNEKKAIDFLMRFNINIVSKDMNMMFDTPYLKYTFESTDLYKINNLINELEEQRERLKSFENTRLTLIEKIK